MIDVIITNKIQCLKCGDDCESTDRHNFSMCKCGAVAADGGHDYLRRVGFREDYKELSIVAWYNEDGTFSHLVAPKLVPMKNWKRGENVG